MDQSFGEYREKLLKKIKESTDINYVRPPFEKANQILKKTFESLSPADFRHDTILLNFYNRWHATNANISKNRKRGIEYKKYLENKAAFSSSNLTSFIDFYTQNPGKLESDIMSKQIDLCSFYINSISDSNNINETIIRLCSHIYPSGELIAETKDILSVLSTFLQNAYIVEETSESPADQSIIDMMEKSLIDEVKDSGVNYVKHTNEKEIRRAQLREISCDTYRFCEKMCKIEQISQILKTRYMSGPDYDFSEQMNRIIASKHTGRGSKSGAAQIKVVNSCSLLECYNAPNSLLLLSNSRMIAGGGSDMGIESCETKTMLATSILYMMQTWEELQFPIDFDRFLYFPKVCAFRNFAHPNFTMFSSKNVKNIAVLSCSPPFRPKTSLNSSESGLFDENLYNEDTILTEEAPIVKKIEAAFECAAMLKYGTVIIDDWGICEFWLPLHHIAKIFSRVAKKYVDRFDNIIFAIENARHCSVFKRYILK